MNQRNANLEDIVSCLLVKPFSSQYFNERTMHIYEDEPTLKLVIRIKDRVFGDYLYDRMAMLR